MYYVFFYLKVICEEGMELNLMKEMCEFCLIGFYKNVLVNDISLNKIERFECKRCLGNLIMYLIKFIDISDCIGVLYFYIYII